MPRWYIDNHIQQLTTYNIEGYVHEKFTKNTIEE